MLMSDFADATAVRCVGPSLYTVEVPDGWQQGRGAFGGLVLATLARAMEHAEPEPTRRLRTLAGDLSGPVLPGAATIHVRTLRRGSNQSNLQAELSQGGEVLATATAVLSAARRVTVNPFTPPAPAPAHAEAVMPLPLDAFPAPVFARHYEYRVTGPLPCSAATQPITAGFIRERSPLARVDAAAMIARLDAFWPTLFSVERTVRPVATISFVAQLLADPAELMPDEPLQYRARMEAASDGFFVEFRELWSGGRVVALNQQTFVVIR
jgi:hypothetical protein